MELICDFALPVVDAFQAAIDVAWEFVGFLGIAPPNLFDIVGGVLGCSWS